MNPKAAKNVRSNGDVFSDLRTFVQCTTLAARQPVTPTAPALYSGLNTQARRSTARRKRAATVESPRMIRDKRTGIAVNAIGAAAALFLLISWSISRPTHALFPQWLLLTDAALLLAFFIYNIVRRLRGPIQPARWARNMSDRQLWIVKGIVIVVVISVTFVFIALRFPRP